MNKPIFNNFNLTDEEILAIIKGYDNLINKYSIINRKLDEDLKQEITINIYTTLTRNRKI